MSEGRRVNSRKYVIVAARKRGWSTTMIAKAAGISHQAVSQILQKAEKQSVIRLKSRKTKPHNPSHPWKCRNCGSVQWSTRKPTKRKGQIFCSVECMSDYTTKVRPTDVALAIQMRFSNQTWEGIGKAIGAPFQTIQYAIWLYLFRNRMLTPDMAHRIWRPAHGLHRKSYSWNHCIQNTGLVPSASGGAKIQREAALDDPFSEPLTTLLRKSDNPSSNTNGLTNPV
jgi:hypothetical protein